MISEIIQQQTAGGLKPYTVAQQNCQDFKRHKSIDVLIPSHTAPFYNVQFVILFQATGASLLGLLNIDDC